MTNRNWSVIPGVLPVSFDEPTYAITDIHGRLDLLELAIDVIDSDRKSHMKSNLISLGDLVDRGPKSKEVIDLVFQWSKTFDDFVFIPGNHDLMFIGSVRNIMNPHIWLSNGGIQAISSHVGKIPETMKDLQDIIVINKEYEKAVNESPLLFERKEIIFSHAGILRSTETPNMNRWFPDKYSPSWIREGFIDDFHWRNAKISNIVVHGHTIWAKEKYGKYHDPVPYAKQCLENFGRINLDAGSFAFSQLLVAKFIGHDIFLSFIAGEDLD